IAFARMSRFSPIRAVTTFYVEVFRTTPTLIQLVWIYYALPIFTGILLDGFTSIAIGLGLHSAAYFSEIFRGGILSIARGKIDAGRCVGMPSSRIMQRIILPQAIRRMLPPFMNETATLINQTTLGSVFAVNELLNASTVLIIDTYRPLEIYTFAALVFA